MDTSKDVINTDLEYICDALEREFSTMSGSRLLIVGGAGFLGYYLVQSVLHHNKRVAPEVRIQLVVYDNYIRGIPAWLEELKDDPCLTTIRHDVTDPVPSDAGHFDYIVHAASIASPIFYRKYPIETMDANVNGLRHLLNYAVAQARTGQPVKGFLYFSTSEIYGDPTPDSIPTPETYRGNVSCTGPRACYDESKRYGETLCVNFAQQFGVPIKIARPFNNYGPGLKISDRRVLPDFARNVLAGEDIVLLSDGSPTRTFCYVADAVVGYYKILIHGQAGEPYNIGVETPEISMRELAHVITAEAARLFDYQGEVVIQSSDDEQYLVDNPVRRCPVITKARTQLGYDPQIGIEEGVRRSLLWYATHNQGEDA